MKEKLFNRIRRLSVPSVHLLPSKINSEDNGPQNQSICCNNARSAYLLVVPLKYLRAARERSLWTVLKVYKYLNWTTNYLTESIFHYAKRLHFDFNKHLALK